MFRALIFLAFLFAVAWIASGQPEAPPVASTIFINNVRIEDVSQPFQPEHGPPLVLDRKVIIHGWGFYGTAFGHDVRFETPDGLAVDAVKVLLDHGRQISAWPPPNLRGPVTVVVVNPDREMASWATGL